MSKKQVQSNITDVQPEAWLPEQNRSENKRDGEQEEGNRPDLNRWGVNETGAGISKMRHKEVIQNSVRQGQTFKIKQEVTKQETKNTRNKENTEN